MPKPRLKTERIPRRLVKLNVFDETVSESDLAYEVFVLLSRRELEVFLRLVQGHPTKIIAADMGLSTRTVDSYRYWVMRKLGLTSIAEEAVLGWRIRKFITAYLTTRSHLLIDHVDIPWDNSRTFEPVA